MLYFNKTLKIKQTAGKTLLDSLHVYKLNLKLFPMAQKVFGSE